MSKIITSGFLTAPVNGIAINTAFPANVKNFTSQIFRTVGYIVIHYTGNDKDTALANAKYFQTAGRGASAHFFVDDYNIYQSVRLKDRAWHCGARAYFHPSCRNSNSVAIEMCCSGGYKVSEKTKENAAQLCARLCEILDILPAADVDKYVLRHWDVTRKQCPAQMSGVNNAEWKAFLKRVVDILYAPPMPLMLVAQEVKDGKWGNGDERRERLAQAGYDPADVQKRVNALCKGGIRAQIIASALTIRAAPDRDSAKLDIFGAGVIVYVEEVRPGNGASAWGRVGNGWVSLDYVREV